MLRSFVLTVFRIVIVCTVLIGGAVFLLAHTAVSMGKKPVDYHCSAPYRYKVGKHIFEFPRGDTEHSYGQVFVDDHLFPCDGRIVPEEWIKYDPAEFFGHSGHSWSTERPNGDFFYIRVAIQSITPADAYDAYHVAEELASQHKALTDLPSESGFYKLDVGHGEALFMSTTIKTPSGNPLTFDCQKETYTDPHKQSYFQCSMGVLWKDGITVGLQEFRTTFIPMSEWPRLYSYLLHYIDGLEVTNRMNTNANGAPHE